MKHSVNEREFRMFSLFKKKSLEVYAPVKGVIMAMADVQDPVFAQNMMGEGIAIQYEEGDAYAPIEGTVASVIKPSYHAFGMQAASGLEVLVHVGLDTVTLGAGIFQPLVNQGDEAHMGDKLLTIHNDALQQSGLMLTTPIVILANDHIKHVEYCVAPGDKAMPGETLIMRCEVC
jgi:hypothetical protein